MVRNVAVGVAAALLLVVGYGLVSWLVRGDELPSIERTYTFEPQLSTTGVYDTTVPIDDLAPGPGYHEVALASSLFADYSQKTRSLHVPEGTQIKADGDGLPVFPDGTTLVKTFYYNHDDRDPSLGRRIIETRLLVKANGVWNAGTYVWNDDQTEATFTVDGDVVPVNWIDQSGRSRSVNFEVPSEQLCVACHQNSGAASPVGPELRHLNFDVDVDGRLVNQLDHLQLVGVLEAVDTTSIASAINYLDESLPLSERGRAYLDMNCSHCHNPDGWERPADEGMDLRYETPFAATGIAFREWNISSQLRKGEMPFYGTTVVDAEGVELIADYFASN